MTFASSGLLSTTQSVLNTTVAQAAIAVLDPSFALTGTADTNLGSNAYPLAYGAAGMTLATPGTTPVTNTYMSVGATAPSSGSNVVYGIAQYGSTQGNAANSCGTFQGACAPAAFSQIYQELLNMANLVYRI